MEQGDHEPAENDNDAGNMTADDFINLHRPQLESSGVPEHLWTTVHRKLSEQVYDAGQYVTEVQEEFEDKPPVYSLSVSVESGLNPADTSSIFIIDHAWSFEVKYARLQLLHHPTLVDRMCRIMSVDQALPKEQKVDLVMKNIWRFAQTCKVRTADQSAGETEPYWYVNDEVGSEIQHTDDPNCKMVPFYWCGDGNLYTLMWPLRFISHGEQLTVDRVMPTKDPLVRKARAQPWCPTDMTDVPFTQVEPDATYFSAFRKEETLPDPEAEYPGIARDRKVRVFMRYQEFDKFLTDPRFELTDSADDADILWMQMTFKDFRGLSESHSGCHISQFPCEMVLTIKDLLAIVARRAAKNPPADPLNPGPKWLPVTYNLETELPQFVSYFQTRAKKGLDNLWICKPWNLARGMDMTITDDLNRIVRLPETGPKVACKYVEDPVLFNREGVGRVKFDIRYIVLLRSVRPLRLYAYKVFWLRFANVAFSLDTFEEYEKHYTVMNYKDDAELKQVHYDEFIPMFEEQYPEFPWATVEESIFTMFKELFQAAVSKPPPAGIGHTDQSRAMYAADLLLKWDQTPNGDRCIVPQLCEVNFSPDCHRACKYHPFFVNDVFSTLFLDDWEDKHVEKLL
ncbi:hypothetical protein BaRGS_00023602 [Batillaria attramentaria]|uniref:Tubulin--tyrosine ligase-like protein 12 SET-like domain-containing protein n=1 Tax=Batillaria attramentaria TaxID=370345 RepID=A0ABD0KDX5_9CAEN